MIQVSILTLVVSGMNGPSVVVLEPHEEHEPGVSRVVSIFIGPTEGMHLGMALDGARTARPMPHDLILDAFTHLDARVDHVVIDAVKDTVFFAKLVIAQHGRLIELDARPSDALALAVRQNADMFIAEDVLDAASFPYIYRTDVDQEQLIEDFRLFVDGLDPEDFLTE